MNKKIIFAITICSLLNTAHAICVKNDSPFMLYYEIFNKNTGFPSPKEKFHSGLLLANHKGCHAHSNQEGDDWKIYRRDFIQVYKYEPSLNTKELICSKQVDGILNTLEVSFTIGAYRWWCLDRRDYED